MYTITSVFLLIVLSVCHGISTTDRQCTPDTIDFATKVQNSSIVVYGKPMAKILNEGTDAIFHVFFQVDCILKGPATLRQINITNAGRVKDNKYCQEFSVGRGYSIAFLEPISPNSTDHKTFIPADFVEITEEGNSTHDLLARTCTLHRLVPLQSLASVTEICPAVATDPICLGIQNTTTINQTTLLLNTTTNLNLSNSTTNTTLLIPGDQGHFAHAIRTPQQELEAIRGKSGASPVDVDKRNGSETITFSILLMIISIFFCSN